MLGKMQWTGDCDMGKRDRGVSDCGDQKEIPGKGGDNMKRIRNIITYFNDDTSITRDALVASLLGVAMLFVASVLVR